MAESSAQTGRTSFDRTLLSSSNLPPLLEEWPGTEEINESQVTDFFSGIVFSMILSYGNDYDTLSLMDERDLRKALRESMKSLVEDETTSVNDVTLYPPFPYPKGVDTTVAIKYYIALDDGIDDNFVRNGVSDLIRWAWDCLQSASNGENGDEMFYFGLIIARSFYFIRQYRLSGEIKNLPSSKPLDPQKLTKWKETLFPKLPHQIKKKATSNMFEVFQRPLPHLAVFAWVLWEYLDYFRYTSLSTPLLQWFLSALKPLRETSTSLPQGNHHAARIILEVIEKHCLWHLSNKKLARTRQETESRSSQSALGELDLVETALSSSNDDEPPLAMILETSIRFLDCDEISGKFGDGMDGVIQSALELVSTVFLFSDLESVKRYRQTILTRCLKLLSAYVPFLSPKCSADTIVLVLSSNLNCIYRIRKTADKKWHIKFNELAIGPDSPFLPDLASCLIPRTHRFPHRIFINAAIKLVSLLISGVKQEHRIINLFMQNGLMLLLRCHDALSQYHLNWLDHKTKILLNDFFTRMDARQSIDRFRFQTQHSIDSILQTSELGRGVVIDCADFLPHHFTPLGAKALSASLSLVLPFNQGHVSAEFLTLFLRDLIFQRNMASISDTQSLSSPTEANRNGIKNEMTIEEDTFKIEMTGDGPRTVHLPEEMWNEAHSTEAISSLHPDHPLSWDQAFMLFQYLGVTSNCAKEFLRGLWSDSVQNAKVTLDLLPTIVCKKLVYSAQRNIPFTKLLRITFCTMLLKTPPRSDIPPWYGAEVTFILLWQQFATDRVGFDCISLASAFVDAGLSSSIVLSWMLLPSCILPYPDSAQMLFSSNRTHGKGFWRYDNKQYFVQFNPGLPFPPRCRYFKSDPAKQFWVCQQQHGMPCRIESPTLHQLGKRLQEVLEVEDDVFQEDNLLVGSYRVAFFFESAVLQNIEEQISKLPGVSNFDYHVQKQKWLVEVVDLKQTLSNPDPRFDTSAMDIVQWVRRSWTKRQLQLSYDGENEHPGPTSSASVICFGRLDHADMRGCFEMRGNVVLGPAHLFFLHKFAYNFNMMDWRRVILCKKESSKQFPLLFNTEFSSLLYPSMDVAFLTFKQEHEPPNWNVDMPRGACLFHEIGVPPKDRLWRLESRMITIMERMHEDFFVRMTGRSKSYTGTISTLDSREAESYGCIIVNNDDPAEPFGCAGDSGQIVWCSTRTNRTEFLLGFLVAGTKAEGIPQQALVAPISNVATLVEPHVFVVRHPIQTASPSATSSSLQFPK